MVSCEEMHERISALMDGELDDEERAFVEAHLAACGDCRRLMGRFAGVDRLVGRVDAMPETGLKARIEGALRSPEGSMGASGTRESTDRSTSKGQPILRRPNTLGLHARLFRLAVAALVVIAVSLVINVMSDRAGADRVDEKVRNLEILHRASFASQDAMLKTLEWELDAMRLMVEGSDLEDDAAAKLMERIDGLRREIESIENRPADDMPGAGEEH